MNTNTLHFWKKKLRAFSSSGLDARYHEAYQRFLDKNNILRLLQIFST